MYYYYDKCIFIWSRWVIRSKCGSFQLWTRWTFSIANLCIKKKKKSCKANWSLTCWPTIVNQWRCSRNMPENHFHFLDEPDWRVHHSELYVVFNLIKIWNEYYKKSCLWYYAVEAYLRFTSFIKSATSQTGSYQVALTRLGGTYSELIYFQKFAQCKCQESNLQTLVNNLKLWSLDELGSQ